MTKNKNTNSSKLLEGYCSGCIRKSKNLYLLNPKFGREVFICKQCKEKTSKRINKLVNYKEVFISDNNKPPMHVIEKVLSKLGKLFISGLDLSVPPEEDLKIISTYNDNTIDWVIAQTYYRSINDFEIKKIQDGKGPSVIVVNGFLSQKTEDIKEWENGLRKKYPNNPWYILRWESKHLYGIEKILTAKRDDELVAGLGMLISKNYYRGNIVGAMSYKIFGLSINNPWLEANTKAAMTGILLALILSRVKGNRKYILFGNSLGAKVVLKTLLTLYLKDLHKISEVHLLGGAVGRKPFKDWRNACKSVKRNVYNYYSRNDQILKRLYTLGTYFRKQPIGYDGIKLKIPYLVDVNVTKYVDGHMKYKPNLDYYIK